MLRPDTRAMGRFTDVLRMVRFNHDGWVGGDLFGTPSSVSGTTIRTKDRLKIGKNRFGYAIYNSEGNLDKWETK